MKNLPLLTLALAGFLIIFSGESCKSEKKQPVSYSFTDPDWAVNGVIYECNVRQFSEAGNFNAVTQELPRLQKMGVNILWLMPIHPIGVKNRKGKLGSPYSVRDFNAVNPDYGTLDDFKTLVATAHQLGMRVIIDWVPNHSSWDNVWMKDHPEYFSKYKGNLTTPLNNAGEPTTDWSDVCDLDYGNSGLRKAMLDAMKYWVKTCDIDGYRADVAGWVPNDFWKSVRPALDSIKPVFLLAENDDVPELFASCFNANYGWKWMNISRDIWKGVQPVQSLDTLAAFSDKYYPAGYYQMYFTQNHDENTWKGTEADIYGESADAFSVLAFTWAGIPLIYNGQEDILVQQLGLFNHTPIQWKKYARTDFYNTLSTLRKNNKALWSGKHGGPMRRIETGAGDQVYAFSREKDGDKVVVVVNLSKLPSSFSLQPAETLIGAYTDVFGKRTIQLAGGMQLNLKPWEYLVLTNK